MDELRGLADEIREAIRSAQRPSTAVWQYAVIVICLLAIAGGCAAYIDWRTSGMVTREEYNLALEEIERLRRDADALRETQTMQMADPKWFNKIEAQNKAIREWRANESNANHGSDSRRVR